MLPEALAIISFSIFIASRINIVSPSDTLSPSLAFSCSILPGIGAITSSPSADATGSLGFGVLGAFCAGMLTTFGVGVETTGLIPPPISSTSTSYVLPSTVILNFSFYKSSS